MQLLRRHCALEESAVRHPPMIISPRILFPQDNRQAGAFTLIELLAVIAVLSTLMAISIPVIGRVSASARSSECVSNLRSLCSASGQYAQDHDGRYPPTFGSVSVDGVRITSTAWWQELYPEYCDNPKAFRCPEDRTGFPANYQETWIKNDRTVANGKVSYGVAGHSSGLTNYKASNQPLGRFTEPGRMVFLTEYQHRDRRLSTTSYGQYPRWPSEVVFPHDSKANVAFLDGHVQKFSAEELELANAEDRIIFNPADPLKTQ